MDFYFTGTISSGSSLYNILANKNLTCYELLKSFESLGDCELTKRYKLCIKGMKRMID